LNFRKEGVMEEPIQRVDNLQIVESDAKQVVDVSFTEVPSGITHKINLGGVFGGVAFLSILLIPGAVEGENYILALALMAALVLFASLSAREDGKIK